jgi:apolipoprotein N-acyltransferase
MAVGNPLRPLHLHFGAKTLEAVRLLIGAASGAAVSLSFTGLYWGIYAWICVAVLLFAIFGARAKVAFACGFLHGFAFVLTSVPWIATVLAVHGGLSVAGGWGILLLIAFVWGLLLGTVVWAMHRLSRRSIGLACIGAPFLWVTFELARAHLPEISFPWNLLGYAAAPNLGLLQITTVTGIYGLSFLVVAFNSLLAWAATSVSMKLERRIGIAAAGGAILVLMMILGPRFVPQAQAHHFARAVQLNFPEAQSYPPDWFPTHTADFQEIERISLAPGANKPDLLVWPEAPAPLSYQDAQFIPIGLSLASKFGHPFLAGVIEWKPPVDASDRSPRGTIVPYNSAVLVDAQGRRLFSYDKVHLVPFGEYEPFPLIHQVVASVSEEVGGFHKGNKYAVGQLPNGYKLGVFICYEAIYPAEVRRFVANGAQLLINISNDGWFGRSAAPEQHLHMVRVRAVENRRWIVRSTNNGFTASVDPYGRIYELLAPDVRGAVDLPYDFRTEETFYSRHGDWFGWLCFMVSVILVAGTFRKAN